LIHTLIFTIKSYFTDRL